MKKFIVYIVLINLIPFWVNIFFRNDIEKDKNELKYHNEIRLFKTNEDKVVNMDLEEYIKGVTYAEMPASFEDEALKAQAVAARTYTYRKIGQSSHINSDICDNPSHCQAFREKDDSENYRKIANAVDATRGEIITYEGNVINALFHSSSGGKTESVEEVWNTNKIFYLTSVDSPGEEELMKDFTVEVVYDNNDFINKLKSKYEDFVYSEIVKIIDRNESGRVKYIKIGNKDFNGVEIRKIFDLRSSNFEIFVDGEKIKFIVKGYGHGVGLSQWGAQAMALKNTNYKDILTHYYSGTDIVNLL